MTANCSLGAVTTGLTEEDMQYEIYDSGTYLANCRAVTAAKLITLKPVMARPPGTTFLGASASVAPCRLGSIDAPEKKVIVDSGSDITLMSYELYNTLEPKPKIRTGKRIKLITVTGNSTITGFIPIDLYFTTKEGPVKMTLEAYVVKGMNADFILGNDFADQYRLSLIRDGKGTRLTFGETQRYVEIENSVDEEGTRAFTRGTKATLIQTDNRQRARQPSDREKYVRVKDDVLIPALTVKFVPILAELNGLQEAYVESIELVQSNLEGSLHLIEAIVSKGDASIMVVNSTRKSLKLSQGEPIGILRDPKTWLESRESPSEEALIGLRAMHVVSKLFQPNMRPAHDDDSHLHEKIAAPSGGPKTAEAPDPTPIPSSRLLKEVNFNPQLAGEQLKRLQSVIVKNAKAFGLDGRLGKHATKVRI
jgi:hypothetical protein